jgi:hypothetical protein
VITSKLSSEMLMMGSISEAKEIIAEENFSGGIVMESNEDEVDERPDGSLKEILKSSDQHRENVLVLEAYKEIEESRVLQTDCLFDCVVAFLQENGNGKIHTTVIKEKEEELSHE